MDHRKSTATFPSVKGAVDLDSDQMITIWQILDIFLIFRKPSTPEILLKLP